MAANKPSLSQGLTLHRELRQELRREPRRELSWRTVLRRHTAKQKSEDTPRIGSLQLPQSICEKEKILRPFAARHGAAARLAQIKRATALAETIWANA